MSEELMNNENDTEEIREEAVEEDTTEVESDNTNEENAESTTRPLSELNQEYFDNLNELISIEEQALEDRNELTKPINAEEEMMEHVRKILLSEVKNAVHEVYDKLKESPLNDNISLYYIMSDYVNKCKALVDLNNISYSVSGKDWEWVPLKIAEGSETLTVKFKDFEKDIPVEYAEVNRRDNNVYRLNKDNNLVYKLDAIRLIDPKKGITQIKEGISLRFVKLPLLTDSIQAEVRFKDVPEDGNLDNLEIEEYVTMSEEELRDNTVFTTDNSRSPVMFLAPIPEMFYEEAGLNVDEEHDKVLNKYMHVDNTVAEDTEDTVVEPEVVSTGVEE